MIKQFKDLEYKSNAIIYPSQLENLKEIYLDGDYELCAELAITMIEMGLTGGEYSSDDRMVRMITRDYASTANKNADRYKSKMESNIEFDISQNKLNEIAEMTLRGVTQKQIANELGISDRTVRNRLNKIKEKYPEMLNMKPTTNGGGKKRNEAEDYNDIDIDIDIDIDNDIEKDKEKEIDTADNGGCFPANEATDEVGQQYVYDTSQPLEF